MAGLIAVRAGSRTRLCHRPADPPSGREHTPRHGRPESGRGLGGGRDRARVRAAVYAPYGGYPMAAMVSSNWSNVSSGFTADTTAGVSGRSR